MHYFSSSYTVYYPFERLYIGILNPYYNIYTTPSTYPHRSRTHSHLYLYCAFRTLKTTPFARSAHTHQALIKNNKENPQSTYIKRVFFVVLAFIRLLHLTYSFLCRLFHMHTQRDNEFCFNYYCILNMSLLLKTQCITLASSYSVHHSCASSSEF